MKAWSIVRLYTARRDGGDDSHGGINIELADLDFDVQRARDYFRGARAAANGGDEDNPIDCILSAADDTAKQEFELKRFGMKDEEP